MKLLPPQQANDLRQQEQLRQIMRTQELEKAAANARTQLAKAEAEFAATLAKNREQWASEEAEHLQAVTARTEELATLESRRLAAVAPIEELHKQAQQHTADALLHEENVKRREEEVEDIALKLQDRLDELGQREQDVGKRELAATAKEQSLAAYGNDLSERGKGLAGKVAEFSATYQKAEAELVARQTDAAVIEANLVSRDAMLVDRQRRLEAQEARIDRKSGDLAKQRKAALVPVEELKAKAQLLVDSAQKNAVKTKQTLDEVALRRSELETDYRLRVSLLESREKAVIANEEQMLAIRRKFNKDRQAAEQYADILQADIKRFDFDRQEFELNKTKFAQEKAQTYSEANERVRQAELTEAAAKETLQQSLAAEEATKQLRLLLDEQKRQQDSRRSELDLLADELLTRSATVANSERLTSEGAAALVIEQEQFAQWRTEAEAVIDDKALANSAKQKELKKLDDKLKRQEKFLAKWNSQLQDERATLQRAWAEVKKSNIPL